MVIPAPRSAFALLLALCAALAPPAAPGAAPLDPGRIAWREIHMTGRVLFMSASARLAVSQRPVETIRAAMRRVPAGQALLPGDTVTELRYDATGFGRRSTITLWMDPLTGAALQSTHHDDGARLRHRTYRYTDGGAWLWTAWPGDGEAGRPHDEWSRREEGRRQWPAAAGNAPVIEASGLLYALATAPLAAQGDTLTLHVHQRRQVHGVRATVTGTVDVPADYRARRAAGTQAQRGTVSALAIRLEGQAVEDADDDDEGVEIFGIGGPLEVALDPVTRVPLQIRGRVKVFGGVTLRLAEVRLP